MQFDLKPVEVLRKTGGRFGPLFAFLANLWVIFVDDFSKVAGKRPELKKGPCDSWPGELRCGWILHYVVAVGYAAMFAVFMELGWLQADAVDGLVFGIASVAVPWFFFMPALGAGVMARNTPNPPVACATALMMHALFGLSLGLGFALLSG